ncbi:hypothetical protein N657DRAFT_127625 [Parathielavia appendiculata]|uniref:Uncharacterized protein n=1 Tax=Parathielavia appendiculata TaxID=2587402 RepID=A0AAN6TV85_9PEZI|nr:hypothetical protein N657DRAFT_127625 [Parathielavia appendiculata]
MLRKAPLTESPSQDHRPGQSMPSFRAQLQTSPWSSRGRWSPCRPCRLWRLRNHRRCKAAGRCVRTTVEKPRASQGNRTGRSRLISRLSWTRLSQDFSVGRDYLAHRHPQQSGC